MLENESKQNVNQKNNKSHPSIIRQVLVSILFLGIGILIGFFIPHQQKSEQANSPVSSKSSATSGNKESNSNYVDAVKELIKSRYYQPVDDEKLAKGSIKGMLDSLNDPYTTYLDPQESQSLNETISSSIVGIGVTIMERNKFLVVESVIDGSPAKKAGIRAKDIITKVNGKSVIGKQPVEVTKVIRGEKGTKVLVTVKRGDQEINFNMERNTIPIETVKSKIIAPKTGLITVSSFSNPTFDEFKKAVTSLRKAGATKFVIDMRGNPGGELKQALALSSCFLKDDSIIMQVQGRKKSDLKIYRASKEYDQGFKVNEPTVVLVDGESASAAEIFTAALKQNKVPIVGQTSFGKGTVQSVVALPNKAELKMTIAKWLTPDGTWINHRGIKPDYKVNYPEYTKIVLNDVKTPLQQGDVSATTKAVQRGLSALGYDPGNQKGIFNEKTTKALQDFQKKREITVSGKIDRSTIQEVLRALSDLAKNQDPMQKKAIELLQ